MEIHIEVEQRNNYNVNGFNKKTDEVIPIMSSKKTYITALQQPKNHKQQYQQQQAI